jgi:prefoldin subunit 5
VSSWKQQAKKVARKSIGTRAEVARLRKEVDQLQDTVEEYRRLNERLSDVLDIVEEILVPAVDRDEEKLRALLAKV